MTENEKLQDVEESSTNTAREQLDRLTVLQDPEDTANLNAKDYVAEDSEITGGSAGQHGGASQTSLTLPEQAKSDAAIEGNLRPPSSETAPINALHLNNTEAPASSVPSSFTSLLQATVQTVQNTIGNVFSASSPAVTNSPAITSSVTTPTPAVVTADQTQDSQAGNDARQTDETDQSGSSSDGAVAGPIGGSDPQGNNPQDTTNSDTKHNDNGRGNDVIHADDSNPPPITSGDHDQGPGNDSRNVGNNKTDEMDHGGSSGGSNAADPVDSDDTHGNNPQDTTDSETKHDDNGRGNDVVHADDNNPPPITSDDHDQGQGNDTRDLGNDKIDETDQNDTSGDGGDTRGNNPQDTTNSDTKHDDNRRGNDVVHADDSNPPPITSGDHDQGQGNDNRDVGNNKTDETDHSGSSSGSNAADPVDSDDTHGNSPQDTTDSDTKHDNNGRGNDVVHADDNPPQIASGDHDQGQGNDSRDVGNDKTDETDHSGSSTGSAVADPLDNDDTHGNNPQDTTDSDTKHDNNGRGNDAVHADDNPPQIASGDHDQGQGNDSRDVGNNKTDETGHSGSSGGNGVADLFDGDDTHGNNSQDTTDSNTKHDNNERGNDAAHADDSNPQPITSGDHDQGQGNDNRDVGNNKTDEMDHGGSSSGSNAADPVDSDDTHGNNPKDTAGSDTKHNNNGHHNDADHADNSNHGRGDGNPGADDSEHLDVPAPADTQTWDQQIDHPTAPQAPSLDVHSLPEPASNTAVTHTNIPVSRGAKSKAATVLTAPIEVHDVDHSSVTGLDHSNKAHGG